MLRLLISVLLWWPASVLAADYRVGPGDELAIEVFGEGDLTRTVVVRAGGDIAFPLLGAVDVAGLTAEEVSVTLRDALDAQYLRSPHVTVRVAAFRSQKIEVIGAVKKPGVYFLDGPKTLREILTDAGWLDSTKSSGEVVLRRKNGEQVHLTRTELETSAGIPLVAGDVISALEDVFVFVDGEVNRPGAIKYSQGLTVSQALTRAGGAKATARLRRAQLLRDGGIVNIRLRKIIEGDEPDIEMRPGDQLRIKESPI